MPTPVWVLSVDLQTKTATFQSGMAEAAKAARGAFNDIKASSHEGTEAVSKGSINATQALGVLTNALRGDTENALADIIREMSHTSVVMAALPFAAAAGAAGLLVNVAVEVAAKIKEWREEQERLTAEQTRFGTAVQESFNDLDQKILEAGQRADELRNDHLAALQKQLELINRASMKDLISEFENIAKAADPIMKMLQGNWYTLGIGSAGASHALEQFKLQYDDLLSRNKDKEASDLLAGTRQSAEKVLAAQKLMAGSTQGFFGPSDAALGRFDPKIALALSELQKAGVGYSEKEQKAQEAIVAALTKQEDAQARIAKLRDINSSNATTQTGNDASARSSEAARQAAASQLAIAEQVLAADKAMADARLEIANASTQQRLESDIEFAQRDLEIKLQANAAETAALDRAGKDYQNQLKAMQEKEAEIKAQSAASVAGLQSRAQVEQYKKDLTDYEQSERDKIAATQQGSSERLAAIDAAIREAETRSLQESDYYRQLGAQRVQTIAQQTQDENKLRADAGKEAAEHTLAMGQLELQAQLENQAVVDSGRRMTDDKIIAEQLAQSQREFEIKQQALQQQAQALDTTSKDYSNKLKQIQDKELQLIRQHENEKTQIQNQAAIARNSRQLTALSQFEGAFASALSSVIVRQQSFATVMAALGDQVAQGLLSNAMKDAIALDFDREKSAAAAARAGFVAGTKFPFPANLVMAPTLAAANFAAVMAYAGGTDSVPGVGRGDVVPAMLTPGEGVVPRGVMDNLDQMSRNGGFDKGGQTIHVHVRPNYHLQALDSMGIEKTLKKHTATLTRHFNNEVRRMNR